ncbi:MAG: Lrp/AsnC family transcriptional regulator [Candidatus Methanospirareceae archaeon]
MDYLKLKNKDKCILRALLTNGRRSYSELGRHCGVSRQIALEHVRKLTAAGIIRGFSVSLDAEKLGFAFQAYTLIIAKPEQHLREELNTFLRESTHVRRIQLLFGRFDLFLELLFRDKNEMTAFLQELQAFAAIERTETFIVNQTIKDKPEDAFLGLLDQ